MVRAAHSLLSITHSMKLLLLLSDESQLAQQRNKAIEDARAEAEEARGQAVALLNELLGSARGGTSTFQPEGPV